MQDLFDDGLFQSWPLILAGACLFSMLFGLVATMADVLLGGELTLSARVIAFSGLAFVGFIGVALRLRRNKGVD